ncbi:hypothetical protein [Halorubrum ezzemoulense]|uniref:hypothetical protein n=1 Tax=Halorubrum ezzemoulense TaxID=337243 RepID=UPI00232E316B|nr:hypothetical protein [Halorubrum ezzemoulense]MDB2239240.1 hypothetical protein [Halorubrum ezzemoulense]MDB2249272.1 hypothetical protein [Halorubrum ezzemoulense]
MPGGTYLDPYSREQGCDEHTERVAIICQQDSFCFGEPISDIIEAACEEVSDYGDSIDSTQTTDGLQLFERSLESSDEGLDAQCKLLAHSLWIVDPLVLIKQQEKIGFRFQLPRLPDEASVYTWVDKQHKNPENLQREIESTHRDIRIADTVKDIKYWVKSYLDFRVNPNGSEPTVIDWSNEAADEIDDIRER